MTFNLRTRFRHRSVQAGAAVAVLVLPVLVAGSADAAPSVLPAGGPPVAAASSQASGAGSDLNVAPGLGGWNLSADGNAVDIVVDNTTGLAGVHPLTEADFPEAQSQFQTGPFGSGLATVFWPGSAGGNFGSLSTELGLPSQLEPIASQMNDPIKASAQYPSGPGTAEYPQGAPGGVAVMQATAGPGGTTADASIVDQKASTVLGFSSAKGTSSATAANAAQATSSTDLSRVSILGGLIDIGSITSTALAQSDGNNGSGTAVTHVTAVTVLGQKASIGSDGLVLPDFPSTLGSLTGPVVQNALSQVISGLGLTVTELPSSQSSNGAGYDVTSGAVSIEIDPPSSVAPVLEQAASVLAPFFPSQAAIIPTLPGLLQGMTITITLGRATASADASPPFNLNFIPTSIGAPVLAGTGPPVGSSAAAVPVASSSGTSSGGVGPSVAATPSATSNPTGGGTAPTSTAQPAAALVDLSSPLAAGAVLVGVLVALAVGYCLWRLGRMVLASDAGPACPLGQDEPRIPASENQ